MQQNDLFFINDKARNHQNKEMIRAGNIQFYYFHHKIKIKNIYVFSNLKLL